MTESLSLLAWAYNEELLIDEFVRKSAEDLRKVTPDFEIVVVDDGSTDRTWEKLQALKKRYPQLKPVRHEKNQDVGKATQTAVQNATKEVLFWNTVDMFFDTQDLPKILPYLKDYDVIQGVRTSLKANAFFRKLTSLVNYLLIRILFGVPMSEFQNVKFFRRDFGHSLQFESSSVFTNAELAIKAYYRGLRIKEVPMNFQSRTAGKQKGARPKTLWKTFRDIARFWLKWRLLGALERAPQKGTVDRVDYRIWELSRF